MSTDGQSLAACRARFRVADRPRQGPATGVYHAAFTGPAWLGAIAPAGLRLSGLAGWCGKQLDAGGGVNLLRGADGRITPRLRMSGQLARSGADGEPCWQLRYPRQAGWPWRWVVDELRPLDAAGEHWLGLTWLDLPGLRGLSFPFRLQREHGVGLTPASA